MGAESTTMSDMTTAPSPEEPTPLGAAILPFARRLEERGLTVGTPPTGPTPTPTEDRDDQRQRLEARVANYRARWADKAPAMYAAATVDDLDERQHATRIRAWLRSGSFHLVLAGAVGTGKTHAAYAVGNQAVDHGLQVEAWNVGDLLDAMRPASDDRHAERRARTARVLILDDLLAKATDWEVERMTLLLDARVRAELQTVVTTNLTRDQIAETWGHRFMDRLGARLTVVTFTGPSRRADL